MKNFFKQFTERKLIGQKENVSYTQIVGCLFILFGMIVMIVTGVFTNPPLSSAISISFFITMLGIAFAFPSLLEGNEGLSTMRIVVFMMTNVICMLLIRIGWDKTSLNDIGLDQWWMGVIAFVFGAKATQSYFESRMAAPSEASKTGMASVQYSNADIAKLAVAQNEQFLKTKFPNIVSVSDAVHDLNSTYSHVIALYLKDNNTVGIPDKLEVKMPDGSVKTIATEIVKGVGIGKVCTNQLDQIQNTDQAKGSVCCVVVTQNGEKAVVTAGHIYSDGRSDSCNGAITGGSQALINGITIGPWIFQMINYKTDVALASIANYLPDANYQSFAGKNHYTVGDSDVKQTEVILISNVNKTRKGFILDYNTAWDVEYADDVFQKDQVIVIGSTNDRDSSQTLSERGDSGGCVFEPKSGNLVGLILGGNDKFTWVLPLQDLFNSQNFKMV